MSLRETIIQYPKFYSTARSSYRIYYNIFGFSHTFPDYIIIGSRKSGTTSLSKYIIEQPNVYTSSVKEIDFFNRYYYKGINWYKTQFPLNSKKKWHTKILKKKFMTGEASSTYIYHPLAPKRIKEILPDVKLIAVLRNPIDRAYSQYQMEVIHGNENLSFEEAIEKESERIEGEFEKMGTDETYFSHSYQIFSYLAGGLYAEQLKRWYKYFPKNQILIVDNEELNEKTSYVYDKVLNFLELPCFKLKHFERYRKTEYSEMNVNTRKKLVEFFKPYNEKLNSLLNTNFGWDK